MFTENYTARGLKNDCWKRKRDKKLQELYSNNLAELVAIYGRRRVGKTFLVDNVFEDNIFFRHAGLSSIEGNTMREQLVHFHRTLKLSGWEKEDVPTSWLEAFYMLEDLVDQSADKNKIYLKFMRDRKRKSWINIEETRKVLVWKGYAFENVCWNHLNQIKDALKIGGVATEESLW